MKVKVSEITNLMEQVLRRAKYNDDQIPFIIDMYLGGEMRGHVTHGLANFGSFLKHDYSKLPKPEVIAATEACYFIDAKSNPGVLIGQSIADEAIKRARKQIVGFALVKNLDSWLRPGAIAEYIANQGFIAYVVNSGGGSVVAPPGGFDRATGTNPIAYGLPTGDGALVVDIATSKRAWGTVRLANKFDTELPENSFYDSSGQITTNPKEAYSVLPFGDHKGFSLAFFNEIMAGALLGMPMMILSDTGSHFGDKFSDRGAYILVVDPEKTVGLDNFKLQVDSYINKIENTRPLDGQTIRIPGRQAMKKVTDAVENDEMEIPDELWSELQQLENAEEDK
ncbi:Ldh family oxidoreductase [Candidatus Saccharibacteria bacterium]|nr:Ldh family oxidoreductase [Candidatus Saccharibacteria bacterium]